MYPGIFDETFFTSFSEMLKAFFPILVPVIVFVLVWRIWKDLLR